MPSENSGYTQRYNIGPVLVDRARSYGHLFHSNDPPSQSDRTGLLEALNTDSYRLEQLNASGEPAEVDKAHLKRLIDTYRSILSPLRTFPTELLVEVFKHTVEDFFPVFDMSQSPWLLGRVCRRWRAVSRSSAELWASLSLEGSPQLGMPENEEHVLLNILEDALNLSRRKDLSIRYSLSSVPLDTDSQLIRILISQSYRWKDVHFSISPDLVPDIRKIDGRLLSKLVRLHLAPCGLGTLPEETLEPFLLAPSIRDVTLHLVAHSLFSHPPPWRRLIHFRDDYPTTVGDHLTFLSQLKGLESYATPWCITTRGSSSLSSTHITHETLRSLNIKDIDLLQYLVCPALQILSVTIFEVKRSEPNLLNVFRQFSSQSCNLQHLTLFVPFIGPNYYSIMGELSTILFPQLHSFTLVVVPHRPFQIPPRSFLFSAVAFIEARWHPGTLLRRVAITTGLENVESDLLDRLRAFKGEGLDVSYNGKDIQI
ncbi:uncharacterized protein EV420DRAFT_983208 [Desarmillaria tabescens]|uniref:F-box domain-containing protein n=1 Tax=Armillaria tabescens TaxID=1929756 RepID=A0AA39JLV7_ARMTA|nr:uncharacterized protein EV420DRAFT_983208 [Desarmillaria tabescens]KAK0445043.1 hypothetical protein EV420DRAFT_983208 [Desarmillaria tabescens]